MAVRADNVRGGTPCWIRCAGTDVMSPVRARNVRGGTPFGNGVLGRTLWRPAWTVISRWLSVFHMEVVFSGSDTLPTLCK